MFIFYENVKTEICLLKKNIMSEMKSIASESKIAESSTTKMKLNLYQPKSVKDICWTGFPSTSATLISVIRTKEELVSAIFYSKRWGIVLVNRKCKFQLCTLSEHIGKVLDLDLDYEYLPKDLTMFDNEMGDLVFQSDKYHGRGSGSKWIRASDIEKIIKGGSRLVSEYSYENKKGTFDHTEWLAGMKLSQGDHFRLGGSSLQHVFRPYFQFQYDPKLLNNCRFIEEECEKRSLEGVSWKLSSSLEDYKQCGEWKKGQTYQEGRDMVSFNGALYICPPWPMTTGEMDATPAQKWILFRRAPAIAGLLTGMIRDVECFCLVPSKDGKWKLIIGHDGCCSFWDVSSTPTIVVDCARQHAQYVDQNISIVVWDKVAV